MSTYRQLHDALLEKLITVYKEVAEAKSVCRIFFEDAFGVKSLQQAGEFPDTEIDRFTELSGELLKGIPVQYVVGKAFFYGYEWSIGPGALIPRPETEELVEWVLEKIKSKTVLSREPSILDVGTGSGCVAVTLKKKFPKATITGIDISPTALEWASLNARRLGVDITLKELDFLNPAERRKLPKFDIIVSNPPYVLDSEINQMEPRVIDHEPHAALFVPSSDPLRFYRALTAFAESHLTDGGWLLVEGHHSYMEDIVALWQGAEWGGATWRKDLSGRPRLACVQRTPQAFTTA